MCDENLTSEREQSTKLDETACMLKWDTECRTTLFISFNACFVIKIGKGPKFKN